MRSTAQNPYLDQRDFRAVLFQDSKLAKLEDVTSLFDGELEKGGRQQFEVKTPDGKVTGCRAKYRSKTCFLRTSDPAKREVLLLQKNSGIFQYEVYVLLYTKPTEKVFMVAIPFSSMARELFGKIHERKPSAKFVYLKPNIDSLIANLRRDSKGSERVKTVGINWAVAGDSGRSDQAIIRGSDVVHSGMFEHLQAVGNGLSLQIRKMQLRYETPNQSDTLKLSFDKFGNYSVFVRAEGNNLPRVFEVFELLYGGDLILREEAFPVRNRDDEPIVP